MPQWLRQQLMKAYFKKDCRQIRLLNECWFFLPEYRRFPRNDAEERITVMSKAAIP
ncbi:cortex morphogenetic protein CmpA [Paenibacillus rhizoplanae]